MTEEDLRKAYFEWRRTASQNFHPSVTMENAIPKPSLEARMEWLEADAAAQRTAILKLERAVFIHSCSVAVQGAASTWLIWKVLT
jgi:uncharacterized coiled-coil protein SlyX